mmetsp:Transcript_43530/g.87129  ORF Transcript_43530/g.87129 Transcript_43530/m.87129 type:complete len:81 (-) Transcript_43530:173-415(-)
MHRLAVKGERCTIMVGFHACTHCLPSIAIVSLVSSLHTEWLARALSTDAWTKASCVRLMIMDVVVQQMSYALGRGRHALK